MYTRHRRPTGRHGGANSCYGLLCLFATMAGPVSWPSSWGDVLRNLDGCHAGDSSSLMGRNNEGAACTVCHADLSGCTTGTAVASVAVNLVFWLAWVVPTFCGCHGWSQTDGCIVFPLKTAAVTGWEREGKSDTLEMRLMTPQEARYERYNQSLMMMMMMTMR